ncbi:aspartate-semialdehyde dehydrogenase [Sulfolobus sp. S-194]|uniref:aspartate-semialdehyde dehydrogenase n=1 Tax=Sulfolobus sp. S-194 TaxID=2512240 RepID=UPI00143736FC|nr:aspartate-semialdehyde dehydrogenase [Sulfolobus sp. S-194]QIW24159.1 aspartate-semialdehyde dehydrogenase [Sulfolobus sp. S-194]
MADKIKVSLLGSTGMVGQKMVRMLSKHPYIELVKVSASPSKIGKKYKDAVKWIEQGDIPEEVQDLPIVSTNYEDHKDVDVVLSALPNELAESIELELVKNGKIVVSNASPFRMDPDVPLINPEINWEHLELLKFQKERKGWKGFLVKNPNCTAAIMSMPIKPLIEIATKSKIIITTLQAVSGAGYNGISFMAIEGNIIPYIKGEEDKIAKELTKLNGKLENNQIIPANLDSTVTSIRVPTRVGHMGVINIITNERINIEEIKKTLKNFKSLPQQKNLPTAPKQPIIVRDEEDRPQPIIDVNAENGMTVTVGRIRHENNVLRLVVLGDNLVRGAAGITILTVEVMKELGYI